LNELIDGLFRMSDGMSQHTSLCNTFKETSLVAAVTILAASS